MVPHGDDSDRTTARGGDWLLLLAIAVWCWLVMQIVHEAGHVLAGLATGGRTQKLVLHPLAISRTDVDPNPHPLLVVWCGPIFGAAFPLLLWFAGRPFVPPAAEWLMRVFAGFCLVANGGYLAAALWVPSGDTAELLKLGCPRGVIVTVGIALLAAGLWSWHTLGPAFGWSRLSAASRRALTWTLAISGAATAAFETCFSGRV